MIIHYKRYTMKPEWKKSVKNDPNLTKKQKRKIIIEARKDIEKKNIEEFKDVWSGQVVPYLIIIFIVCLIISLIFFR